MDQIVTTSSTDLIGIGLYTPAEAARLLAIPAARISRWLRGHDANEIHYAPLWTPQVACSDDALVLGFRDLLELRVASTFIEKGLSAQRVREAIRLARNMVADSHPLSTTRFRTDGRTVFLQIAEEDGRTSLIDLFRRQFAFKELIERSLTNVEYDEAGIPFKWWPTGKASSVVLDPTRSFGQPIEAETSVPVDALVAASLAEGSDQAAARAWDVPLRAVRRAVAFRRDMDLRLAA